MVVDWGQVHPKMTTDLGSVVNVVMFGRDKSYKIEEAID